MVPCPGELTISYWLWGTKVLPLNSFCSTHLGIFLNTSGVKLMFWASPEFSDVTLGLHSGANNFPHSQWSLLIMSKLSLHTATCPLEELYTAFVSLLPETIRATNKRN